MSQIAITLSVDGREHRLEVDVRSTLVDTLRERLGATAVKKGCDHGQCGSCTVLLDGQRRLTCLSLTVACDGADITTAAGLGSDGALHRLQEAFVEYDAWQCGYCTPGQLCSAIGMLAEAAAGHPSHVTRDLGHAPEPTELAEVAEVAEVAELTDEEIRERLSGNLCRCGAYPNIVAAVRSVEGAR